MHEICGEKLTYILSISVLSVPFKTLSYAKALFPLTVDELRAWASASMAEVVLVLLSCCSLNQKVLYALTISSLGVHCFVSCLQAPTTGLRCWAVGHLVFEIGHELRKMSVRRGTPSCASSQY
jgi:hypothetical protein